MNVGGRSLAGATPLAGVRLLVLDVDGVLTDGRLYFGADGESLKVFHVRDGHGLKLLQAAGVQFVIGSGVRGGRIVGDAGLGALVDGDLPIGIDTRSLYAVALDWLGGPTDDVLGGSFDRYGLI